jgi:hypothetical protein
MAATPPVASARVRLQLGGCTGPGRAGGGASSASAIDRAPSYVELLTCLEMAKQAKELPVESTMGAVTNRP